MMSSARRRIREGSRYTINDGLKLAGGGVVPGLLVYGMPAALGLLEDLSSAVQPWREPVSGCH
jgi:hypothetical protein